MKILALIRFLTTPPPGKIHSVNSPFQQETFRLDQAKAWERRGKARIENGILIFEDDFHNAIQNQVVASELAKREDAAYERSVDLERSMGRTNVPSMGVWSLRQSGHTALGGPKQRVRQMSVRWPAGTFKES